MSAERTGEARPTVMVVDDDAPTRMMAGGFLRRAGFDVVEAADGLEALERIEGARPDLVLLDVEMPRLDGFETCRRLRAAPGFAAVPVLMLTGLDDTGSIELAYRAGATDFATKPLQWSLLCHRLRYMLRASRAQVALAEKERGLAAAQRIARLGNWELDVPGGTMRWSEELCRICALAGDEAAPTLERFLARVHREDRERVRAWIGRAASDALPPGTPARPTIDCRLEPGPHGTRSVRQQVEAVRGADGRVERLLGVLQDFTERRRAERRIRQLAYFDSLTGLPNRVRFRERLERALGEVAARGGRLAVLFLDLDDFKNVNDTLGHAAGDRLLGEVATRLRDGLADLVPEPTVARMGGDEFTVLLPSIEEPGEAVAAARRVIELLERPYRLDGIEVRTGPSVGVAIHPDDGADADALVRNADMALYEAKRLGKGRYRVHDETMEAAARRRFAIDLGLRRALEAGTIEVHYQPQLDIAADLPSAAEALVRWTDETLGPVSPAEFIPVAEANGLILELGEHVLRTACARASRWREAGSPLRRVAVNVSVAQFTRPGFAALVARALDETGLAPEALELEITESLLAADVACARATLGELRRIGVELSIDDFGTGYSSLSQIKHFPIDRLKIDRSFVSDVTTEPQGAAIVRAVIAMAGSLGLRTLAEGVETEAQLRFLVEAGCDEIQGYWLCRPVPADALDAELERIRTLLAATAPLGASREPSGDEPLRRAG